MTTAQTPRTGSGPPEGDPTIGIDSETADAPATRAEPSGWGAAYTALLLLIGTAVVAFVLLLVVLPIRDGKKDGDSAEETYRNFRAGLWATWRDSRARTQPAAGA